MGDSGSVYFKTKTEALTFQRYASKFCFNMFFQSNQVFSDLSVLYRQHYFYFKKGCSDEKNIRSLIEDINYQYDRWSDWSANSTGDYTIYIFNAPSKVITNLIEICNIFHNRAKKSSNTQEVYLINSKLTYLKFLESQYLDFHLISTSKDKSQIKSLPIMKIVSA